MISTSKKAIRVKNTNIETLVILNKLYDLKKDFKNCYSGPLRCKKYEETREFTINLNHSIFLANQKLMGKTILFEDMLQLEKSLQNLQKAFKDLLI